MPAAAERRACLTTAEKARLSEAYFSACVKRANGSRMSRDHDFARSAAGAALAVALDRFDVTLGVKFSTYLFVCMDRQIIHDLRHDETHRLTSVYPNRTNAAGERPKKINRVGFAGLDGEFPRAPAAVDETDTYLSVLTEREKTLVCLRVFGGFSFPLIGAALGCCTQIASRDYRRAVNKVRKSFPQTEVA